MSRAIYASFALAIFGGCAPSPSIDPTLCQLAIERGIHVGRRVTVEGHLLASRHGTGVSDRECERGIAIEWQDEDRGLDALNYWAERSTFEPMAVRVRVTGDVKWRASRHIRHAILWYIDVQAAEVVKVVRLRPDQEAPYVESLYGGRPTDAPAH